MSVPPKSVAVPALDLKAQYRSIRDEIDEVVRRVIESQMFVMGPEVAQLEAELAEYCGAALGVGCGSGTDALLLPLMALGIGPGDEVITTPYTFFATASTIWRLGARPVFVDIEPDTFNIDPARIEPAITPRTRAIIPVHLYGQAADMDPINEVAGRHGLAVVEDAAQAHGATWRDRPAGSMGRLGCFSFYPGKNLGAFGDAGAVVTEDPELAATVRTLRNHGRTDGHHRHDLVGVNSRLDTLQAAVLSAKLTRLGEWTAARRAIADRYREALRGAAGLRMVEVDPAAAPVHHLAVVLADDRDGLRAYLDARGITTAVHYPVPCHLQTAYRAWADGPLPTAEAAAGRITSLPLFPHMTDTQVDLVCDALAAWGGGSTGGR
jgi:dTDP-4-amino-4,6-dideoxygalactose transaminase